MTLEERDILTENIDKLRAYYTKYGNYNVPFRWKEDIPFSKWVENIRRRYPKQITIAWRKRLKKVGINFSPLTDWDIMFFRLADFYDKHGTSSVPPLKNKKLFDWTTAQREAKPSLTQEQIEKLNRLNFDWHAQSKDEVYWREMYQQLVKFKAHYGHLQVTLDHAGATDLYTWVWRQRHLKSRGKLAASRIEKLNAVNFLWKEDVPGSQYEAWEKWYSHLVAHKEVYGHITESKVKKENAKLAAWMSTQRLHQDKLSPHRKKKLTDLDFNWEKEIAPVAEPGKTKVSQQYEEHQIKKRGEREIQFEKQWNGFYEKLKAYKAAHGHCQVQRKEDHSLALWVVRNKVKHKRLSKERKEKLQQLDFKWTFDLSEENWTVRYDELLAFKKMHNHVQVPLSNSRLFIWIQTQRRARLGGTLKRERIAKLEKLGLDWKDDIKKKELAFWEAHYKKLKELKERYGDAHLVALKQEPDLRNWARSQVKIKETLSSDQQEKLRAINFDHWSYSDWEQMWEEKYQQLVAYKEKHGHCDVPQNFKGPLENNTLSKWVNAQRSAKLSAYRKEKLTKLGFHWSHELFEMRWLAHLQEFVQLKKTKGKIPDKSPLRRWLYEQERTFNLLSDERKKKLIKAGVFKKQKKTGK